MAKTRTFAVIQVSAVTNLTGYDEDGYDINGFDKFGNDRDGLDIEDYIEINSERGSDLFLNLFLHSSIM